ncbi:hypothetical protein CCR75_001419 [Bremia lactucae]|uniref:WRKY19-like zinc finger domain-containing protein n=1 Tax=Bremia lactucae TaxID=4779 RepID=A0A976IDN3_BRELC|nr:hypothetical protein CCR75_001419 [Bremia lactucae]
MKKGPPSTSNNKNSSSASYFHHVLDRTNNYSISTNPSLYTQTSNLSADTVPVSTGKRPRPNTSNNISNCSFLAPFGFLSPLLETEHPLPELSTNWGYNNRNMSKYPSATTRPGNNSSNNTSSLVNTSGIGQEISSSSAVTMFTGVDSFLPEYDPTFNSLWNPTGGNNGMMYAPEDDLVQGDQQQARPPLYMASDEELKMEYPQLSEFTQDFESYLNDTIKANASPSNPLAMSTMKSGMKRDFFMARDSGDLGLGAKTELDIANCGTREVQGQRLLSAMPAVAASNLSLLPEHGMTGQKRTFSRATRRARGADDGAYAIVPICNDESADATSSCRTSSKSPIVDSKQDVMPSLGPKHSGQSHKISAEMSRAIMAEPQSEASTTPTFKASFNSNASVSDSSKLVKRPRSRQCEFPGCPNRARSHQKCKKHGGAHQCVFEGCTKNSQSRGLCIAHGGGSRCKKEGCVRAAQSKGLCKSHGGGEYCAVESCNKKAHLKHLCRTHGGGVRCKVDKCSKWAQRKGWCMAHAKEFAAT